jgi:phosphohistidine phosphatase
MLLLVHHGDALAPGIDPMQPLSPKGVSASTALAQEVAARGVTPDVIWHSGKVRALQTAQLFRAACNPAAGFKAVHGLLPGDPPQWLYDTLQGERRSVLLVGHMPHLPGLLALLVGEPRQGAALDVPLNGCVALEPDGDRWTEVWRLDPRDR